MQGNFPRVKITADHLVILKQRDLIVKSPASPVRSSEKWKTAINMQIQNTRDFTRVLKLIWSSTRHESCYFKTEFQK